MFYIKRINLVVLRRHASETKIRRYEAKIPNLRINSHVCFETVENKCVCLCMLKCKCVVSLAWCSRRDSRYPVDASKYHVLRQQTGDDNIVSSYDISLNNKYDLRCISSFHASTRQHSSALMASDVSISLFANEYRQWYLVSCDSWSFTAKISRFRHSNDWYCDQWTDFTTTNSNTDIVSANDKWARDLNLWSTNRISTDIAHSGMPERISHAWQHFLRFWSDERLAAQARTRPFTDKISKKWLSAMWYRLCHPHEQYPL